MTDDDRPRGSCVIKDCPRDPYPHEDGRRPYVCGPDASRLRHWLREIPELAGELSGGGYVMRDSVGERLEKLTEGGSSVPVARYGPPPARLAAKEPDHPLVLRAGQPVEHRDLVANLLPAGPIGGAQRGGPVSGSSEPRLPIAVDAVDLLGPARSLRRLDHEDDMGFVSIASTLDFWVQDLRDHRARGEGLPEPSVTVLAGWLLDRLDEAADDWLPIDEFFEDIRRTYGALRGQLGQIEVPDYRHGIPCPKCSRLSLVRQAGGDYVVCTECGAYLLITEYERYVKTMSVEALAERKRSAADRRALVRLLREMHAVGWRHAVEWTGHTDPDTGALDVEVVLHYWRRGDEEIEASVWLAPAHGIDLRYGSAADTTDGWIGSAWIAANGGGTRLHKLASAAGVLSVPRERAA